MIHFPRAATAERPVVREGELLSAAGAVTVAIIEDFLETLVAVAWHGRIDVTKTVQYLSLSSLIT